MEYKASDAVKSVGRRLQMTCLTAEATQVDSGTGPRLIDSRTGEERKTWFFLMMLRRSRHQYAEPVLNQKIDTWLNCHRHAFEWFNGVFGRIILITPNVQLAAPALTIRKRKERMRNAPKAMDLESTPVHLASLGRKDAWNHSLFILGAGILVAMNIILSK